jgi:hypothetical protein
VGPALPDESPPAAVGVRPRPPVPVMAAVGLLALVAAATMASGTAAFRAIAGLVVAVFIAPVLYYLWWGSRLARSIIVFLMACTVAVALFDLAKQDWVSAIDIVRSGVIVGLLLLPLSARSWFAGSGRPLTAPTSD